MRDLPPLNALLAFEIVARTGSVRAAADELLVTPSAISRQIRLLEEHFGVALFARQGRGLTMTSVGAAYYERVTSHFDGLRKASALLHASSGRSVLKLRSYTTFATRWLLPRLSHFQLAHPEIDVRLTTESQWSELGDFDAAIRLGDGQWPEHHAVPLVPNVLRPVCSPALLKGPETKDASWLAQQTLLFVRARPDDWGLWCDGAGIDMRRLKRRRELESSALAYQAALEGHGVALAQLVLVEDELAAGDLVAPIAFALDRRNVTYHLVSDVRSQKRRVLDQLQRWLTSGGGA
ncbi:Transcriptional regulator, LysR family [Azospirillum argentinense]